MDILRQDVESQRERRLPLKGVLVPPPPTYTKLLRPERPGHRTADEAEPPWQGRWAPRPHRHPHCLMSGWNGLSPSPSFKRNEYELVPLFSFATCLMAGTELEKFHTHPSHARPSTQPRSQPCTRMSTRVTAPIPRVSDGVQPVPATITFLSEKRDGSPRHYLHQGRADLLNTMRKISPSLSSACTQPRGTIPAGDSQELSSAGHAFSCPPHIRHLYLLLLHSLFSHVILCSPLPAFFSSPSSSLNETAVT